jgi:thiamine biosynthesis protein ThiI
MSAPNRVFLVKYGEISLKGANRRQFEERLIKQIHKPLAGTPHRVRRAWGRIYVEDYTDSAAVARALGDTFGIVSYAEADVVDRDAVAHDADLLDGAAVELARRLAASAAAATFKIEARRSDKAYPQTSYQIACRLGDRICAALPALGVDVHAPGFVLSVEVRDRIYLYGPSSPGRGGLPVGASARGLLLLSGGIDSPIAGYLMGKRGMPLDHVYFHSYPYTSDDALAKVQRLAEHLARYVPDARLCTISFTAINELIKQRAPDRLSTLLLRACMMRAATLLARRTGAVALVTGESLGQVASQTGEAIAFTDSTSELPVLRPLIGMDKEEIVRTARAIGTFETSTLPYPDCCTLFAAKHPVLRPKLAHMHAALRALEADELIAAAADGTAPGAERLSPLPP